MLELRAKYRKIQELALLDWRISKRRLGTSWPRFSRFYQAQLPDA